MSKTRTKARERRIFTLINNNDNMARFVWNPLSQQKRRVPACNTSRKRRAWALDVNTRDLLHHVNQGAATCLQAAMEHRSAMLTAMFLHHTIQIDHVGYEYQEPLMRQCSWCSDYWALRHNVILFVLVEIPHASRSGAWWCSPGRRSTAAISQRKALWKNQLLYQ